MIQSLHIFRKDLRHLWLDLLLYAALLVACSVVTPMTWNEANMSNTPLQLFAGLLKVLIPLIWLVLISRLIHDEALVGDTQFWITRPYRWTSLLSAKLIFLLFCVVLPFAVMQWALVLQAGANPLHAISGQLLVLLSTTLIVWLPFTVAASVKSVVQRMFLWLLAIVIVWGAVLTALGSSVGPRMPFPLAAELMAIVIGALLVGTLVYQYASRDTRRSRAAFVAITVLFVAMFWSLEEGEIAALVNFSVRRHYPLSTNGPLQLVFNPNVIPSQDAGKGAHTIGKLVIARLPITLQGPVPITQLDHQNVSFVIDAPGYRYTSPWRPADLLDDNLMLFLPQAALDAAHGSNVHMHISEVAQRLMPGTPHAVIVASEFRVPGDGNCRLPSRLSGDNVSCRYPYEIKLRTTIQGTVADDSCSSGPTHPGMETLGTRFSGNGLDPTISIPLRLGGKICLGTQLTFTDYHPAENFRLELDIPSISLDRYLVR
jgi:hypothetical protein